MLASSIHIVLLIFTHSCGNGTNQGSDEARSRRKSFLYGLQLPCCHLSVSLFSSLLQTHTHTHTNTHMLHGCLLLVGHQNPISPSLRKSRWRQSCFPGRACKHTDTQTHTHTHTVYMTLIFLPTRKINRTL